MEDDLASFPSFMAYKKESPDCCQNIGPGFGGNHLLPTNHADGVAVRGVIFAVKMVQGALGQNGGDD